MRKADCLYAISTSMEKPEFARDWSERHKHVLSVKFERWLYKKFIFHHNPTGINVRAEVENGDHMKSVLLGHQHVPLNYFKCY